MINDKSIYMYLLVYLYLNKTLHTYFYLLIHYHNYQNHIKYICI